MPMPRIDPRMLQMLMQGGPLPQPMGLTLNSAPVTNIADNLPQAPAGIRQQPERAFDSWADAIKTHPGNRTLHVADPAASVIPISDSGPYGAIPIRPGGFAGDRGQGMPYTGTAERSDRNFEQAKMLQQALKALRTSGLGK